MIIKNGEFLSAMLEKNRKTNNDDDDEENDEVKEESSAAASAKYVSIFTMILSFILIVFFIYKMVNSVNELDKYKQALSQANSTTNQIKELVQRMIEDAITRYLGIIFLVICNCVIICTICGCIIKNSNAIKVNSENNKTKNKK